MLDPASLFNAAQLSIHVPPFPLKNVPPVTEVPQDGKINVEGDDSEDTDEFVRRLTESGERDEAFYDESLPFYLLLRLPASADLTRAQATSILLQSLKPSPHLTLSADVSYVEGSQSARIPNHSNPVSTGRQDHPNSNETRRGTALFPSSSFSLQGQSATTVPSLSINTSTGGLSPKLANTVPPTNNSSTEIHIGSDGNIEIGNSSGSNGPMPRVPMTPSPFPSTAARDANYVDAVGIPLWSFAFTPSSGLSAEENRNGANNEENKENDKKFEGSRAWVGKVPSSSAQGAGSNWVGVWEFKADVAYMASALIEPRLCLTVTMTFRDDPRLETVLNNQNADKAVNQSEHDTEDEEDEYMMESFDDVNLLEGLDEASDLHLPASRLPLPSQLRSSNPGGSQRFSVSRRRSSVNSLQRRASSSSSSFVNNLPVDPPLYPAIRRAFRRVLKVRSPINVRMRSVVCPFPRPGSCWSSPANGDQSAPPILASDSMGVEDEEGIAMCIEIEGSGVEPSGEATAASLNTGTRIGFEIVSISVVVSAGRGDGLKGDIEVRPIEDDRNGAEQFPILIKSSDQFNFLYGVSFTRQDNLVADNLMVGTSDLSYTGRKELPPPVPLQIASSPSQRFTAKFGDPLPFESLAPGARERTAMERATEINQKRPWMRDVAIIVTGRPVKLAQLISNQAEGKSLIRSNQLDSSSTGDPTSKSEENLDSDGSFPTDSFASRWNCTLDISSFTSKAILKQTRFTQKATVPVISSIVPVNTLSQLSLASTGASMAATLAKRNQLNSDHLEAIAGSKRHTIASLAALAHKSPHLNRIRQIERQRAYISSPAPPLLVENSDSRALPPTPSEVETPGATGPTRRFFSLPYTPASPQLQSASEAEIPYLTSSPPPVENYPSSRSSFPFFEPLKVFGVGGVNILGSPTAAPIDGSREHWANPSTMAEPPSFGPRGLGLPVHVAARAQANVADQNAGSILVSVSFSPLRTVKKRNVRAHVNGSTENHRSGRVKKTPSLGLAFKEESPKSTQHSVLQTDSHTNADQNDSPNHLQPEFESPWGDSDSPNSTYQFPSASPSPDVSAAPATVTAVPVPVSPPTPVERTNSQSGAVSWEPQWRTPKIGLLDVFLVEVFLLNRSDTVKRFTVGVPARQALTEEDGENDGVTDREVAHIVALENDVRIGPLAPSTCASVRLRFLAIRPGAHTLEELRLVDLGTGLETRLLCPLSIVVDG